MKPELQKITYEGRNTVVQWKSSECFSSSSSFYVLSIGDRQSVLASEKCTLTQPLCEKNISTLLSLYTVNQVLGSESDVTCQVHGNFDKLCLEHNEGFLNAPGKFLCSEELLTELKCTSSEFLILVYIGVPLLCVIFVGILCSLMTKKIMNMRDIKCVPPRGLIEVNEHRNEEMFNLMSVNR